MPLQNRVTPAGELVAVTSRGLFMGNRGGRFHRDDRTLGARRWVSRAWICCVTQFKGRHRAVWENGYTELFFLDEPTALAAGHRSCFECRRGDALAFAASWAAARHEPVPPRAAEPESVFALRSGHLLRWRPEGYDGSRPRPRDTLVDVLTPPSILGVLAQDYRPQWHPSAAACLTGRRP